MWNICWNIKWGKRSSEIKKKTTNYCSVVLDWDITRYLLATAEVHHALVSPTYWHKEVLSPRFKKKKAPSDTCAFSSSHFHLTQMNNVHKSAWVVVIVPCTSIQCRILLSGMWKTLLCERNKQDQNKWQANIIYINCLEETTTHQGYMCKIKANWLVCTYKQNS